VQGRRRCLCDSSLGVARSEALEGSFVARLRHLGSLEWFRTFCLCTENELIDFKLSEVICACMMYSQHASMTFHSLIVWRSMIGSCSLDPDYETVRNVTEDEAYMFPSFLTKVGVNSNRLCKLNTVWTTGVCLPGEIIFLLPHQTLVWSRTRTASHLVGIWNSTFSVYTRLEICEA
jgi:hypothetical protein